MTAITRAQREALKRVYDRQALTMTCRNGQRFADRWENYGHDRRKMTYRQFRKLARPAFGIDCLMVPWCGMWLGIERDGYTHS